MPRSKHAQLLLQALASAGAAGSKDHGVSLDDSEALQELLKKDYACKMVLLGRTDHQQYTLTMRGRACFRAAVRVEDPVPILQFKRKNLGTNLGEYSSAELILHLAEQGWTDLEKKKTKKATPFVLGAEKIWYRSTGVRPSRLYLQSLAVAHDRIQSGCISELHHFQPQAYYKAVCEGHIGIKPNQPLSFYKIIAKNQKMYGEASGDASTPPPKNTTGDGANDETAFEFAECGLLAYCDEWGVMHP